MEGSEKGRNGKEKKGINYAGKRKRKVEKGKKEERKNNVKKNKTR